MWYKILAQAGAAQPAAAGFFHNFDKALTFWTFLAIGTAACAFVIFSLIMGEISDVFGGADHDIGHAEHDAGHADIGGGHPGDMAGLSTPHLFSFRIIVSFFAGFGLVGAICTWEGQPVLTSCAFGVLVGCIMAGMMYAFVYFLASQQASVNVSDNDLLNQEAQVMVRIPADGLGQVRLNTTSGTLTKVAMSMDNKEIPEGALVKIVRIAGQTAYVSRSVESQK
jgi:membrane protein implicated in regulation of membrane protease activity